MNKIKMIVILIFLINIFVYAEDAKEGKEIIYQTPISGVELDFNSSYFKIKSMAEWDLIIGDKRDIRQAKEKAILKAKSNLAKFLNENISSTSTLEEITKTASNSTSSTTTSSRKMVETLVEKISNSSEALLKGVIVLETKVDTKEKSVSVTLGTSEKTMDMADKISNRLLSNSENSIEKQDKKDYKEIRRSKNYDNF